MFIHLPWGVGQLCFPPNKVPSHCRESHSCYWHKGLMGADCIRQPVLTLLFHGGGKHNSISLPPLWRDSSRPQKSHHLHLPVAKWHKTKGIKEKLSLRKTPYSHFPTLLSSSCIFSEENLFEDGTKSVWTVHDPESWENFTINLEWHKKGGGEQPLGSIIRVQSSITRPGTIIPFPGSLNLNFILAYWSMWTESEGLW